MATEHENKHLIEYTVDGEKQSTAQDDMTPNQILRDAGIDPANHYLVRLEGHHQFSFQDKGNEPIHVHNHEQFISLSIGPTPLS